MPAFFFAIILLFSAFALPGFAFAAETYVLGVANAESFDRSLPTLRFAENDLQRFQQALKRVAFIPDDHFLIQKDSNRDSLRSSFLALADKISKRRSGDVKFIFYFSGHSDTAGLHMADGLLAKEELHKLLALLPVQTRIAFFDSCYSGALAPKGIRPSEDFVIPRAEYDEPSGSVFLSATSASAVAFELEELRGSIFTHHLVNGLYGSADSNTNGLVTIDELYQYVYQQMSIQAFQYPSRELQKPEYSVKLQGRGALVLAQVKQAMAQVQIAKDIKGEIRLATDSGLQVFKLSKTAEQSMNVLLFPAEYNVIVEDGDMIGKTVLSVKKDGASLGKSQLRFEKAPRLAAIAKGERSRRRFGAMLSAHNSTYAVWGPQIEGEYLSPSRRIEDIDFRFLSSIGFRSNELDYNKQSGRSEALTLLLGLRASILPSWTLDGQDLRFMIGLGVDRVEQRWDSHPGEHWRTFRKNIPKVSYGIGTSFIDASGKSWGLFVRRDFPFATDARNGDVLAFGSNNYAFGLEW